MDLEQVELESIDNPLWMRTDTTDERCLNEVFEQLAYELPFNSPPRTIIDAGANAGHSTVFFAQRFLDARIIAIEPDRENFQMLLKNIAPRFPG
ncbi:MAG: hypothetical protein KDA57_19285 [Planctomycetales bacterium]|nr:hypothetical protein [Planctomycetales bacterium]